MLIIKIDYNKLKKRKCIHFNALIFNTYMYAHKNKSHFKINLDKKIN
jgi:hypothetical protein